MSAVPTWVAEVALRTAPDLSQHRKRNAHVEEIVMCGSNSVAWSPVAQGWVATLSSETEADWGGQGWCQTARFPRAVCTDRARPIPLGQPSPGLGASVDGPPSLPSLREQCSSRPNPDDDDILDDEDEDDDALDDDFDVDDDPDE